ncbi:hypothetical protein CLD22_29840 [Rubrivivax gelatinosus]|nr:hypothetical protein [Rubrivivax gelatinosus]
MLRERPFTADANRDWDLLHPLFRQRLLAVFATARERHGYELVLLEGYRSAQRQAQLAALGPATTRAAADQSRHQAGLAADVAFRRDGRLLVSERDPWTRQAYLHYGQIAKSFGLEWGGDWKSIRDLGHVEMQAPPANPPLPVPAAAMAAAR